MSNRLLVVMALVISIGGIAELAWVDANPGSAPVLEASGDRVRWVGSADAPAPGRYPGTLVKDTDENFECACPTEHKGCVCRIVQPLPE